MRGSWQNDALRALLRDDEMNGLLDASPTACHTGAGMVQTHLR